MLAPLKRVLEDMATGTEAAEPGDVTAGYFRAYEHLGRMSPNRRDAVARPKEPKPASERRTVVRSGQRNCVVCCCYPAQQPVEQVWDVNPQRHVRMWSQVPRSRCPSRPARAQSRGMRPRPARCAAPRWRSRRPLWHARFPFAKLSESLPFLVQARMRFGKQAQN
jgi:hypothetical protein